jgi:hypothetical protein
MRIILDNIIVNNYHSNQFFNFILHYLHFFKYKINIICLFTCNNFNVFNNLNKKLLKKFKKHQLI